MDSDPAPEHIRSDNLNTFGKCDVVADNGG